MASGPHKILDDLMEEVKKRLMEEEVDKIKRELLVEVDKKQNEFLQDVMNICDKIFGDFVQASEKCKLEVAEMIRQGKGEMFSSLRFEVMKGMVQDEVKHQLEKLKVKMEEKEHPSPSIFIRKDIFKTQVLDYHQKQQRNNQGEEEEKGNDQEESQSLLALAEMEVDVDNNLQR